MKDGNEANVSERNYAFTDRRTLKIISRKIRQVRVRLSSTAYSLASYFSAQASLLFWAIKRIISIIKPCSSGVCSGCGLRINIVPLP